MGKSYLVGFISSILVNAVLWGGVLYLRSTNQIDNSTVLWVLVGSSIGFEASTRGRLKRLEEKASIE